jgi:hypothetical protein
VTLGSREASDIALKFRDVGVGAGLQLAEDRLFVGAEAHTRTDQYDDLDRFTGYTNKVSTTSLAVGTEYLALENVAARAGLVFSSDDRTFDQGLSGTFGTSSASIGVGRVPSGGILQMDAAYTHAALRAGYRREFVFTLYPAPLLGGSEGWQGGNRRRPSVSADFTWQGGKGVDILH